MEQIKLGTAIKRKFYITDASNLLKNVDTPPGATGLLYREDADSGAVVSLTNITTGVYSAAVSILGINGFVKNSIGELEIAATVGGVLLKNSIWSGIVENADVDDLPNIGGIATGVWGFTGIRSLSDKVGFGVTGVASLSIGDAATGVWGYAGAKALTDKTMFGVTGLPVLADVVTGIWGAPSRTLTDKVGFGVTGIPVLADNVTGIWGAPNRTLTDKAGYSTTGLPTIGDIATGVWGFTGIRGLSDKAGFGEARISL